jgi:hypothetical protein
MWFFLAEGDWETVARTHTYTCSRKSRVLHSTLVLKERSLL